MFHIFFHGESKPHDVSTSPTLVNLETLLISEEESTIPFSPYPIPFPIPVGVPLCIIVDPSLQHASTSHDLYPMEETLEWFMEPRVKTNPSIPQDDTSTLNLNLEFGSTESITSSRDIFHPLSSVCHDSLYHDLLDKSAPSNTSSRSLDFQVVGSN